jgi:heme-degrading monooxygenase HmoA
MALRVSHNHTKKTEGAIMADLTVSAEASTVTFIQAWTFLSQENQKQFIHTMKEQFKVITGMPGSIAMALHPSLDGRHVIVYAQWQSQATYEKGINDPTAKQGHSALAQWGESVGNLYQVDTIFLPS